MKGDHKDLAITIHLWGTFVFSCFFHISLWYKNLKYAEWKKLLGKSCWKETLPVGAVSPESSVGGTGISVSGGELVSSESTTFTINIQQYTMLMPVVNFLNPNHSWFWMVILGSMIQIKCYDNEVFPNKTYPYG